MIWLGFWELTSRAWNSTLAACRWTHKKVNQPRNWWQLVLLNSHLVNLKFGKKKRIYEHKPAGFKKWWKNKFKKIVDKTLNQCIVIIVIFLINNFFVTFIGIFPLNIFSIIFIVMICSLWALVHHHHSPRPHY